MKNKNSRLSRLVLIFVLASLARLRPATAGPDIASRSIDHAEPATRFAAFQREMKALDSSPGTDIDKQAIETQLDESILFAQDALTRPESLSSAEMQLHENVLRRAAASTALHSVPLFGPRQDAKMALVQKLSEELGDARRRMMASAAQGRLAIDDRSKLNEAAEGPMVRAGAMLESARTPRAFGLRPISLSSKSDVAPDAEMPVMAASSGGSAFSGIFKRLAGSAILMLATASLARAADSMSVHTATIDPTGLVPLAIVWAALVGMVLGMWINESKRFELYIDSSGPQKIEGLLLVFPGLVLGGLAGFYFATSLMHATPLFGFISGAFVGTIFSILLVDPKRNVENVLASFLPLVIGMMWYGLAAAYLGSTAPLQGFLIAIGEGLLAFCIASAGVYYLAQKGLPVLPTLLLAYAAGFFFFLY